MKRFLKLTAATLAALLGVGLALFFGAVAVGEHKRGRSVEVKVVPVAYTKDAAALRLGKYLFETRGCGECHGMDGAGRVFIDDPNGLHVRSPNLTPGAPGTVAKYGEADWVRAIRHGVAPDGRALLIMPSEDYNRMNDGDLAALVGYIRSLPPVDGKPAELRLPLFLKALYGVGVIPDAATRIDHKLPPAPPVPVAANAEHGGYVASMCMGCHGATFDGGKIPGAPPEWPPAAKLTPGPGSAMAKYDTEAKFAAMMRTGKRPDGSEVSKVMPFPSLSRMNDVDLAAMYAYFTSLGRGGSAAQ